MRKEKNLNPTHPSKQPLPSHGSPLPPVGGTCRTSCASLAPGRGGRAGEAGEGGGRANTGNIAFVSGTASGAGARCCGCRSPLLPAPLPQAPRRRRRAPRLRAGERAARRLLISSPLAFSWCYFCLFSVEDPTHALTLPPPEVSLAPAGIRNAPGDFPTQAGVYEREGDQTQRRERCFQG